MQPGVLPAPHLALVEAGSPLSVLLTHLGCATCVPAQAQHIVLSARGRELVLSVQLAKAMAGADGSKQGRLT